MGKPLIGLDIDGVLANTPKKLAEIFSRELGFEIKEKDIRLFDLDKLYKGRAYDIFKTNELEIYVNVELEEGALETLNRLKKDFHIIYLSNRPTTFYDITLNWIRLNGLPLLNYTSLIFTHDKVSITKRMNISLVVEDNPYNIELMANAHIPVIIFDRPYNDYINPSGTFRAKNWHEVCKLIKKAGLTCE